MSFQSVAELWYGSIKANESEEARRVLEGRIQNFVVLAPDQETIRTWAQLKAQAQRAGLSKDAGDLWIAASARRHALQLLTYDKGFLTALGIKLILL